MTTLDYYWIMAERQKHASDEAFARAIEAKARIIALNDAVVAADNVQQIFKVNGFDKQAAGAQAALEEIKALA